MQTWLRTLQCTASVLCSGAVFFATPVEAEKDLVVGALLSPTVVARQGNFPTGRSALSSGTTACNEGTTDIPWRAPMGTDHPGMLFALYRESEGRFEQVGVSDIRHFFFALSGSVCSPCGDVSNGTYLAPGCSDATGTANNADLFFLAPRSEWNPYLGEWDCLASHFADGQPDCERRHDGSTDGPLDHRLVIRDMDLNIPGAGFFLETYYVVREEANRIDNVGFREVAATWTGSQWSFSTVGPLEMGPALQATAGESVWGSFASDGELLLHTRTSDNGDGTWHYEYSLYNLAADQRVRRVAVPVGDAGIRDIAFHRADPNPLAQWPGTATDGTVVWEVEAAGAAPPEGRAPDSGSPARTLPESPALQFGDLFNYRFDADSPPSAGTITVEAWRTHATIQFATSVPSAESASVETSSFGTTLQLSAAPNPSQGGAVLFTLDLATREDITLAVFAPSGQRVRTLCERALPAGRHSFSWDPRTEDSLPAGLYFARARTAGGNIQRASVTILNAP